MICTFDYDGGLMHFKNLDALYNFHVFSLAWRFKDLATTDPWTMRLNAFKEKDPKAVNAACSVMPYAVSKRNWPQRTFTMVSAIPSTEEVLPKASGLFRLGKAISSAVSWEWKPEAVNKKPHRPLHTIYNAPERAAEIAGKYSIVHSITTDYVCILDDLITRGDTMADIVRAIKEHNHRVMVFGLVLGKSETYSYAIDNGHEISNDHVPSEYATMWDKNYK